MSPEPTDWTTLDGHAASRMVVQQPADVPQLRSQFRELGIPTYEADIRFATNYLINRNIRGSCAIVGSPKIGENGVDLAFTNPSITPASSTLSPKVLSLDIETDPNAQDLLAISIYGKDLDEVLIVDTHQRVPPTNASLYQSEAALLKVFLAKLRHFDPDVITGWNVVGFDLTVLAKIAQRNGVPFEIGRGPGRLRLREAQGYFGSGQAIVPGRIVLDGTDLMRGAFIRQPDYSLEAVARAVLGEGKAMSGANEQRHDEIMRNYETDLDAFALYARTDARLALEIVEKLKLVSLAVARSKLTGMHMDRVSASIASFDFVYLAELHQQRVCAPSVGEGSAPKNESHAGGYVLEPKTGVHQNVWILDFKSLYPSIIRTFNIDPQQYIPESTPTDGIRLINGAHFTRTRGVLPRILTELTHTREAAKASNDDIASQAVKILMNSFYGVLATPQCRFHNSKIGNAITTMGRHLLSWTKNWFEEHGYRVLYGDTDSVFVHSGVPDPEIAVEKGRELVSAVNEELAKYIHDTWQVASQLVLEFEKLYSQLFLMPMRSGTTGARKRYAGLRFGSDSVIEYVGTEVVRRDWTEIAKDVQRELYSRLFAEQPIQSYLHDCVTQVRNGKLDDKLIYCKSLRKDLAEYTMTSPPHVVAARKSKSTSQLIYYTISTAGPEPIDNQCHPIDREHYVQKQIRPVAEPVLQTLGLDFDGVVNAGDELF